MTSDEKEAILVQLFNNKNEKEKESKSVSNNLKELRILKSRVASELADMKTKKRDVILYLIGKGRYADIVMEPVRLRNEFNNLEKSATEKYDGEYDKKAVKAFEGKGPVLQEDIELAEVEAKKAEEEISAILDQYIELESRKKGINKSIKNQKMILKELSRELKKINKNIKKTDKKKTDEHVLRRTK